MFRRAGVAFIFACIVLAGTWSLLHPGFFRAHDFVHAARIAEMDRALQAGHIPPRWSANFGYGYGMPLFNFYAPLPYIVGALLYQVVSVVTAIKMLLVLATIGTTVGAYKLSREFTGLTASLLAALAATLAPYRALNMYVRGALSEIWGIAWMPWVFLGAARIARARGGLLILVCSVAGMVLSHNLVTLMAVLLSGLWAVTLLVGEYWFAKATVRELLARLLRLMLGYIGGFGLASWYVLPSIFEKQFTRLDSTILTGYFDFRLHFLYIRQLITNNWGYGGSEWGPSDGISFFLGYGQLFSFAVVLGLLAFHVVQSINNRKKKLLAKHLQAASIGVLLLISLSLTLTHAQPFWEALPFFKYLQFPWRWLSVSTVFLALLVAYSHELCSTKFTKTLLTVTLFLLLLLPVTQFRPESYLDDADGLYYTDGEHIRTHMSEILPDYIPSLVEIDSLPPATSILTDSTNTTLHEHLLDRPHEHLLVIEQLNEGAVEFSIAYFPGWRAEIDGTQVLIEPNEHGLISLAIPQGKHTVGIFFTESPIRKVANSLSLASAAVLGWYWLSSKYKNSRV